MKFKTTAVIVIYNKELTQSITYQKIRALDYKIDILIVDNSEIKNFNQLECEKEGIRYICMHGNKGLSKAYNVAIENSLQSEVVILFDDDTEVPEEYFSILNQA